MSSATNQQEDATDPLADILDDVERRLAALRTRGREQNRISAGEIQAINEATDRLIDTIESASPEPTASPACAQNDDSNDENEKTAVLLVEDNTINRMVAQEMLRRFHCRIDIATNGAEAVRQFQGTAYDLIFMDCHMPVMDGFEAVAKIRGIESGREQLNEAHVQTPIVALTANALKGDRDKCLAAGMNDYVSKPFSLDDLQGAIERQLGSEKTTQIRALADRDQEQLRRSPGDSVEDTLSGAQPAIDTSVLDSIKRLTKTNGEELLHKVVNVFLETSPRLVEELDGALTENDLAAIVESAHALRSCCSSVGAARLSAICATIEKQDARVNVVCPAEWQVQLRLRYKEVREELHSVLEATQ